MMGYGTYVVRGMGFRGFGTKAVIPFIGLYGFREVANRGINWMR